VTVARAKHRLSLIADAYVNTMIDILKIQLDEDLSTA